MAHRRQHSGFGNINVINGVNPSLITKHSADIDELTRKSHTPSILRPRTYFTDLTTKKAIMYTIASLYVIGCGLASMAEPFLVLPCFIPEGEKPIAYPNPNYDGSRCPNVRYSKLLFLNKIECSFGRRLVMSIIMGSLIGWERRQADRPAGIRTMSLVSLGSCLFTINSAFAFVSGPEDWDASRISAAIPSGVGFLGAGLIFKKTNDGDNMVVHGLTTAASVWLSAAVGIACGGELYFAATFGTCLMMLLLRFGPRGIGAEDDMDEDPDETEKLDVFHEEQPNPMNPAPIPAIVGGKDLVGEAHVVETTHLLPGQEVIRKVASMKSLTSASLRTSSGRDRKRSKKAATAHLGSLV